MRAPAMEPGRTLTDYSGGIADTLDGSHGPSFTYLPVVYEDDCQIVSSDDQFLADENTWYEVTAGFLAEEFSSEALIEQRDRADGKRGSWLARGVGLQSRRGAPLLIPRTLGCAVARLG